MSDFAELCPIFNTGVFGEVIFPGPMSLSGVSTGVDLLAGTASKPIAEGWFTFGRTVIVTGGFIKRETSTNTVEAILNLRHKTSGTAALAGTNFATIVLALSGSQHELLYTWVPFPAFTGKTFTSSEVLALSVTSTTASSGAVALMIRYKTK